MENRSWIVPSESQRNDALFALKQHKYKVGRNDTFTGLHELSVEANEDDWEHVEKILRAHAPGARMNKPG